MQLIISLTILITAMTFSMMQETHNTPETMVLAEQIELLKAKVVRLRNLKNLLKDSTIFRTWEGTCPSELDAQIPCVKFTDLNGGNCICWSSAKMKVNWFTATAFCDYHGMHLISFSLADQINNVQLEKFWNSVGRVGIWTSGSDVITHRLWTFRTGQTLGKLQNGSYPDRDHPTTCISANLTDTGNKLIFEPGSCLETKPFVCQQFIF